MKNRHLFSIFILLALGSFAFIGCESGSSSTPGTTAAEPVTLSDLQGDSDISIPTGTATQVASKEETGELTGHLMDLSDTISDNIDDLVDSSMKDFAKNLKSSVKSSLVKSKAPVTEGGEDSWDESGTINGSDIGWGSGYIDWESTGSYSGSQTYDVEAGTYSGNENGSASFKLKLVDIVPEEDVELDGFVNENGSENTNSSGSWDTETGLDTSYIFNGTFSFSHRSGYSISGDMYTCYVVISGDLSATVNISLNEEQLAEMTGEDDIENYIDDNMNATGSMTVTVYNADGTVARQDTFTAAEVIAWDDDEEGEGEP